MANEYFDKGHGKSIYPSRQILARTWLMATLEEIFSQNMAYGYLIREFLARTRLTDI
jgi:hypothetical protein